MPSRRPKFELRANASEATTVNAAQHLTHCTYSNYSSYFVYFMTCKELPNGVRQGNTVGTTKLKHETTPNNQMRNQTTDNAAQEINAEGEIVTLTAPFAHAIATPRWW